MSLNSNAGAQFTTDGTLSGATPKAMYGQNELLLQQAIAYRYTTAFAELNRYAWDLQQKSSIGCFASISTVTLDRGGMIIKGMLADGQERLLFRTDGQGRSYGFKYDDHGELVCAITAVTKDIIPSLVDTATPELVIKKSRENSSAPWKEHGWKRHGYDWKEFPTHASKASFEVLEDGSVLEHCAPLMQFFKPKTLYSISIS
jgi:YD repeat-containing protein